MLSDGDWTDSSDEDRFSMATDSDKDSGEESDQFVRDEANPPQEGEPESIEPDARVLSDNDDESSNEEIEENEDEDVEDANSSQIIQDDSDQSEKDQGTEDEEE